MHLSVRHQTPLHFHVLINKANGEQDKGIPFHGPNPVIEADESAVEKTPDLEQAEFPKSPIAAGLRRDSLKNIGQRRRSSASNQPAVNLRRGLSHFRLKLICSPRIWQRERNGTKCRSLNGTLYM